MERKIVDTDDVIIPKIKKDDLTNNEHPRLLIFGTSPYDKQGPARAFESYFSNWERENLIQVFSSPNKPKAGHCEKLYQITDAQMLKRWVSKKNKTGVIFHYNELQNINEETVTDKSEVSSGFISKLYAIGKKKTPLVYLLRGILWKKKYWCTEKLDKFIEDFHPECIFLAFSDDYFLLNMSLYYAEIYNIPIVSCIGDDYYFNTKQSISPLYWLYKCTYKRLVRKVFLHGGSAAYIGDKIRDKYNQEFCLSGQTVYLSSEIEPHEFRPIDNQNPRIVYCGNIRLGRNHSLNDIGNALALINKNYYMDVYSNEKNEIVYKELQKNANIRYHGAIPYSEVMREMSAGDILVVVEGFDEKDVNSTRYSLSTKVADSLATGGCVLAYGSKDCGAIGYAKSIGCVVVCTEQDRLVQTIEQLISDVDIQKRNYCEAMKIVEKHHKIKSSTSVFEQIIELAIKNY